MASTPLERRIRALARKLGVSREIIIDCALRIGLEAGTEAFAERLMDDALEPLRQAGRKYRGKSLEQMARDGRKRRRK